MAFEKENEKAREKKRETDRGIELTKPETTYSWPLTFTCDSRADMYFSGGRLRAKLSRACVAARDTLSSSSASSSSSSFSFWTIILKSKTKNYNRHEVQCKTFRSLIKKKKGGGHFSGSKAGICTACFGDS